MNGVCAVDGNTCAANGTTTCKRNTECGIPGQSCGCLMPPSLDGPYLCQNVSNGDAWCGSLCVKDSDCPPYSPGGSTCNVCVDGACSQRGCGSTCTNDGECSNGVMGCTKCLSGQCAVPPGQCNAPCSHDSDCSGQCPRCLDDRGFPRVCVPPPTPAPPPPQCGTYCPNFNRCARAADGCDYCHRLHRCTTYDAAKEQGLLWPGDE
mmetsp:Transcript_241/g.945  ORF Transcript_241/g.945 Transcript_241/m.945 type:complete len:206 (+) Transcript_241:431-1048(+)